MEKIKIVAIVGSFRKNSYNHQLALLAKNILDDKVEFEILDFADVPLFNQDVEYPAPEAVKRVRDKVKAADGIWFFTPEYNHYFPGVLKNLIDWLSRPVSDKERQVLSRKPAAISGITLGMSGTATAQDHLVALISLLNMDVMNAPRLTIPNAMRQLNDKDQLELTESVPFLQKQAAAFVTFIQIRKSLGKD